MQTDILQLSNLRFGLQSQAGLKPTEILSSANIEYIKRLARRIERSSRVHSGKGESLSLSLQKSMPFCKMVKSCNVVMSLHQAIGRGHLQSCAARCPHQVGHEPRFDRCIFCSFAVGMPSILAVILGCTAGTWGSCESLIIETIHGCATPYALA